jgi:hypothetical protein
MERSKQIQVGLLTALALLLIANLFGGGFKNWFGKSGTNVAAVASMEGNTVGNDANNSGNIPGTNENTTLAPTGPTTTIEYDNATYNFGTVNEGDVVKHTFKFKNTGNEPLLITNAKGSCGCTVPTWPKEPIAPGEIGELKVEFNTKGKPSNQTKKVTVTANTTPTETFVEVTGMVKSKEQPTAKGGTK